MRVSLWKPFLFAIPLTIQLTMDRNALPHCPRNPSRNNAKLEVGTMSQTYLSSTSRDTKPSC